LLNKGNQIQRALQLVCPLEIRSQNGNTEALAEATVQGRNSEITRAAAQGALTSV